MSRVATPLARRALRNGRRVPPARQRGVVLVIALVVLVLVTVLGVSMLRTTTMQERMAGNSRDRDKALQAAEAAVQACLSEVSGGTYTLVPLTPVAAGGTAHWDVAANWSDSGKSKEVAVSSDGGLSSSPRCMVEALDLAKGSYRVTGRAVGGSDQTVVMLQATMTEE